MIFPPDAPVSQGQPVKTSDHVSGTVWMGGDKAPADILAPAPDLVNHPPHYTASPSGVECIQVARHMNFNLGNALKYLWRAGQKGDAIVDLEKSIWYIRDEIQRLGGPAAEGHPK
jgi:hypothetical protein